MKKNIFTYLLLFIVIEALLIFIVFREIPHVSLFTTMWILHILFFTSIVICWFFRLKATKIRTKFIFTYLPLIFHLINHIIISFWIFYIFNDIIYNHSHDNNEIIWMILSVIFIWIFIFIWEYLIHKKTHCETHHNKVHKKCHDSNCISKH